MFLCDECSPVGFQSFLQSRGKCEDCGKLRTCNDVPTDLLTGTADDAISRSTVAAMEAHLKQTATPARPEGLLELLRETDEFIMRLVIQAEGLHERIERALAEKAGASIK